MFLQVLKQKTSHRLSKSLQKTPPLPFTCLYLLLVSFKCRYDEDCRQLHMIVIQKNSYCTVILLLHRYIEKRPGSISRIPAALNTSNGFANEFCCIVSDPYHVTGYTKYTKLYSLATVANKPILKFIKQRNLEKMSQGLSPDFLLYPS